MAAFWKRQSVRLGARKDLPTGSILSVKVLASFALAFAVIFGILALFLVGQYRQVLATWEERQSSIADDRTRLVSNWLRERSKDAVANANAPEVIAYLSSLAAQRNVREASANRVLAHLAVLNLTTDSSGYLGAYVLNRDGRVVTQEAGSSRPYPWLETDSLRAMERGHLQIDWFPQGLGRFCFSIVSPVSQKSEKITAGQPIRKPLGALALAVSPNETMFPFLTEETVPTKTGETLLVARKGNEILYLSPVRHGPAGFRRVPHRPTLAASAAVAGPGTFGRFVDYRGVPVLAAVRNIPGTDLGLEAKIDYDEAFAHFRREACAEIGAALLLLLAIGGCFVAYHRQIWGTSLALRAAEIRGFLESTPDGLVILDTQGSVVLLNSQTEEMFGYLREELLGQSFTLLVPEVSRPGDPSMVIPTPAGPGLGIEVKGRRKDGTPFPVELCPSPVAGNEEGRLYVAIRDLTERKRIEQNLKNSEEQYSVLFNSGNDAAFVFRLYADGEVGNFLQVNDMACERLGYTREELLQRSLRDILPPEAILREATLRERLATGERCLFETEHLAKDGRTIPVEVNARLVDLGGVPTILGVARDLTERKRMEEKLRRIAAVVEACTDFIGLASVDGEVLYVNPAGRQFVGLDDEDHPAKGTRLIEYVADEDRQNLLDNILPQIAREGRWAGENRFKNFRTGALTPMWHSVFYITDPQTGQRTAMATICRDLSERKRSESELRAAQQAAEVGNRAKSRFLANMSHEIRTPLNGILGMTALLLTTTLSPEQRHYAEIVHSSGENLLALINQILDLSKIEAGKVALEKLDFELETVLKEATQTIALEARNKGLEFTLVVDPGVPLFLRGDPVRLRQVISNLAANAVKFTFAGGVSILVEAAGQEDGLVTLQFAVRDTGIGVAPEQAGNLFSPFAQADESTTRKFGGTGLGLAISKQLVELMGGHIGCESEPGRGSCFSFTALVEKRPGGAVALPAATVTSVPDVSAALDKQGLRILVAEDNAVNSQVVLAILNHLGYSAETVVNGSEAVETLKAGQYDLVLMDCQMPEMDGYEATGLIRDPTTGALNPRIPIVALTASAMTGDREKCIAAGMDDYLSKPIRPDSLRRILGKWLGGAQQKVTTDVAHPPENPPEDSSVFDPAARRGQNARQTVVPS
jgi:PAS domain S-box-containing protein